MLLAQPRSGTDKQSIDFATDQNALRNLTRATETRVENDYSVPEVDARPEVAAQTTPAPFQW